MVHRGPLKRRLELRLGPVLCQCLYQVSASLQRHILLDRWQLNVEHVVLHLLALLSTHSDCRLIILRGHLLIWHGLLDFVKFALADTFHSPDNLMPIEVYLCHVLRVRVHRLNLLLLQQVDPEFDTRFWFRLRLMHSLCLLLHFVLQVKLDFILIFL